MRGGARVKIHRFAYGVAAIALLGFGATTARANSRAGVGTTGPGSDPCSSFAVTLSGGAIPQDTANQCTEGVNATSIEVIGSTSDAFMLYSSLLETPIVDAGSLFQQAGADLILATIGPWKQVCGLDGTGGFECTLTAPTETPAEMLSLAPYVKAGIINDDDCDQDDTIFFVPANCDLFFTTGAIGGLTGPNEGNGTLFNTADTLTAVSGVPEPGTVALLLAGMLGLFAFRRKYAL